MNENIDLTKILKNCPNGTELYSLVHGEVEFQKVDTVFTYSILVKLKNGIIKGFTSNGKLFNNFNGECILFPSRNQRDWSKFTAPWYKKEKFDHKTNKRLRKTAVAFLKDFAEQGYENAVECIDWLEKQGESNPYSGVSFKYNGHTWGMCGRDNGVEILVDGEIKERIFLDNKPRDKSAFEAIKDEKVDNELAKKLCSEYVQNSADKIKPRFNVGDWIVFIKSKSVYQVEKKENYEYTLRHILGGSLCLPFSNEGLIREWTIQDAMDGDVLSFYSEYKSNKIVQIGIIEKYVGKYGGCSNTFKIYAGVNWDNNLQIGKYMGCSINMGCSNIHPATKEQRDTLMKAMNDAGYEWDAENKELKKKRKE